MRGLVRCGVELFASFGTLHCTPLLSQPLTASFLHIWDLPLIHLSPSSHSLFCHICLPPFSSFHSPPFPSPPCLLLTCLPCVQVGVKVSAVSRKTNTTQREVVGIRTTGPTQLVFHDTPGLTVALPSQPLSASQRQGSLLASSAALHCHVVALVIDADRQIR
ncbi:unnamed protein product, partial [Closterium sp. NIES-53]